MQTKSTKQLQIKMTTSNLFYLRKYFVIFVHNLTKQGKCQSRTSSLPHSTASSNAAQQARQRQVWIVMPLLYHSNPGFEPHDLPHWKQCSTLFKVFFVVFLRCVYATLRCRLTVWENIHCSSLLAKVCTQKRKVCFV